MRCCGAPATAGCCFSRRWHSRLAGAFGFVALEHWTQHWVWESLPHALGHSAAPWWWPLPALALCGVLVAFAIGKGARDQMPLVIVAAVVAFMAGELLRGRLAGSAPEGEAP